MAKDAGGHGSEAKRGLALTKMSDTALESHIRGLSNKWMAAHDEARAKPGYQDLRPSELRAMPSEHPIHGIYSKMNEISNQQHQAYSHQQYRRTHGATYARKTDAARYSRRDDE
jgi:hypothetical protein